MSRDPHVAYELMQKWKLFVKAQTKKKYQKKLWRKNSKKS